MKKGKAIPNAEEAARASTRASPWQIMVNRGPKIPVQPLNSEMEGSSQDPNGKKRSRSRDGKPKKKPMSWTPQLHEKFLEAIGHLESVGAEVKPKNIQKYMERFGIDRDQIASRLQKHRLSDNNPRQTDASGLRFVLPETVGLSIPNPMNSGVNNNPYQAYASNGQAIWPNSGGPQNLQIPSWNSSVNNNPHQTYASNGQAIRPNSGGSRNLPIPSLGPTNVMTGLTDPNSALPVFTAANASASPHFSPAPTTQPPVPRIERRNLREPHVMKNAPTVVNSPAQQNYGHGFIEDIVYYRPANKGQEGIPRQGVISSSSGTDVNGPSNELQRFEITDSGYQLEDFASCFEQDPGQDIQLNGHDNEAPENRLPLPSNERSNLQQGNNANGTIPLLEPITSMNDLFADEESYPDRLYENPVDDLLHGGSFL